MSHHASHRFARISPRKVRPLADMIRGKLVDDALDLLRYQPDRGARLLERVIRSALGNARDADHPQNRGKNVDVEQLVVTGVAVDKGPMIKRVRPRARGMAYIVRKRMSHISITLNDLSEL